MGYDNPKSQFTFNTAIANLGTGPQRFDKEVNMSEMTFLLVRPTPATSALVRTKEAALYLGISKKKLRRLVRLGEIPVIQQKHWLFRVTDLDKYVASLKTTEYPTPAGTNHFGEREVQ